MTTIAIKNMSTAVTSQQLANVVIALQTQVNRDWARYWGSSAIITGLNKNQNIPAGAWPLYLMDYTDSPGALGYHTETANGVPWGRVFVKTAQQLGYSWTVTLSHELLEMLGDPNICLTAMNQTSDTQGTIYALEVGDPCEADAMGYRINNILLSDFVTPAWFDQYQTAAGTVYDFTRHLTAPFQIGAGGYMDVFNITAGSGWQSVTHNNQVVPGESRTSDRGRRGR